MYPTPPTDHLHSSADNSSAQSPDTLHASSTSHIARNVRRRPEPPPLDAKIGSEHFPWLRLSEWELFELQRRMKKSSKWKPSEDMVKRELQEAGRDAQAYMKTKKQAAIRGIEFVDDDKIEEQYMGKERIHHFTDWKRPNMGMKLNQAKKRKREMVDASEKQSPQGESNNDTTEIEGRLRSESADSSRGSRTMIDRSALTAPAHNTRGSSRTNRIDQVSSPSPAVGRNAPHSNPKIASNHQRNTGPEDADKSNKSSTIMRGDDMASSAISLQESIEHTSSVILYIYSFLSDKERKDLASTHNLSVSHLKEWLLVNDYPSIHQTDKNSKLAELIARHKLLVHAMSHESLLAANQMCRNAQAPQSSIHDTDSPKPREQTNHPQTPATPGLKCSVEHGVREQRSGDPSMPIHLRSQSHESTDFDLDEFLGSQIDEPPGSARDPTHGPSPENSDVGAPDGLGSKLSELAGDPSIDVGILRWEPRPTNRQQRPHPLSPLEARSSSHQFAPLGSSPLSFQHSSATFPSAPSTAVPSSVTSAARSTQSPFIDKAADTSEVLSMSSSVVAQQSISSPSLDTHQDEALGLGSYATKNNVPTANRPVRPNVLPNHGVPSLPLAPHKQLMGMSRASLEHTTPTKNTSMATHGHEPPKDRPPRAVHHRLADFIFHGKFK